MLEPKENLRIDHSSALRTETSKIDVRFLGTGGANQEGLGYSAAVVEINAEHKLLIDCGPGTIYRYKNRYGELPKAIYITHCHLDHIADIEPLFAQAWFNQPERICPQIFVPVELFETLHQRLGTYPGALAEGGINFWEGFQLIPVSKQFLFGGFTFKIYPVRHHAPFSAFCLHLPGHFLYSGDTRPIPEIISHCANQGEVIYHDCALTGNPSHAGIEDLRREYSEEQLARLRLYHLKNSAEIEATSNLNLNAVT